jgi:hypothetical protein
MANPKSDEGTLWKRLLSDERLPHVPQGVTAGVVTVGLAAYAFPAELCDRPCANPNGGGAAALPGNFDIDTVPTPTSWLPVAGTPVATGGTVTR